MLLGEECDGSLYHYPNGPWDKIKSLDITRFTIGTDCLWPLLPPSITDISQNFPSLQNLAVKGELSYIWNHPSHMLPPGPYAPDTWTDLSSGLANLSQLKTLDLDLRPTDDDEDRSRAAIIHRLRLGPLGFLSLKDIPSLVTVKLPFHAIIGYDESPARLHYIPDPAYVLPSALTSLTIRMDFEDLKAFLPRRYDPHTTPPMFDRPWQPRMAALAFLEAIADLKYDLFPDLEEVVYCYSCTRETYCRCQTVFEGCLGYYSPWLIPKCEYFTESDYSRFGVHGGQNGGYSDSDADISPDSALMSPPLAFDSALDEHGAQTDVPARFQALVEKFAAMGVNLSVVAREYSRADAELHRKYTEAEHQKLVDLMG